MQGRAERIANSGQQPGLRPEPRLGGRDARAVPRNGIDVVKGARGRHPPVDVSEKHGA